MGDITLTDDQQNAYEAFSRFYLDPAQVVFVLEGFAGTGKTTLVEYLINSIPKLNKTLKLIDPKAADKELELTATTNKAAEALSQISGHQVSTIQSLLSLRVAKDYMTGNTRLVPQPRAEIVEDTLIVIDEASFVDANLLDLIFKQTQDCKIMFIGDPAQLAPVKFSQTPVFNAGFPTARLEEVVRQAKGNPIQDLSTAFRETVNTGEFFSFTPDGHHIQWQPREQFDQSIIDEFDRLDWNHRQSKVLAWTNNTVIKYNRAIRNVVKGSPQFCVGDYAVCNAYVNSKECRMRTDQMALITSISSDTVHDVPGIWYGLDDRHSAFMPDSLELKKQRLNQAKKNEEMHVLRSIQDTWIDLRAAYACTINKSQGSTYDKVFIDLDDVKRCNSANQLARMLYVAVSRARDQVIFTGDLV